MTVPLDTVHDVYARSDKHQHVLVKSESGAHFPSVVSLSFSLARMFHFKALSQDPCSLSLSLCPPPTGSHCVMGAPNLPLSGNALFRCTSRSLVNTDKPKGCDYRVLQT